MGAPLTVAEVLSRAADLIEPERAWTQGCEARDVDGVELVDYSGTDAICWCVGGAIWKAADDVGYKNPNVAMRFLESLLDVCNVPEWNDAPKRTQSEVVAKLREAAALSLANPSTFEVSK